MRLYHKAVNWSVFDGEMTLERAAHPNLLGSIFVNGDTTRNITLLIDEQPYPARLMNVTSSSSIQIGYGNQVKTVFVAKFVRTYNYYLKERESARRQGISTRKVHPPEDFQEYIRVEDTDDPLIYRIICMPYAIGEQTE